MGSRLLGLVMLAALAGCITPSIPIPPPDPSDINFNITTVGSNSTAVMTYPATTVYIGSVAYVFDEVNGYGVIQRANADGSIGPTLPLPVALGDEIIVSVTSNQQTQSTCVILQQGAQNPNAQCP